MPTRKPQVSPPSQQPTAIPTGVTLDSTWFAVLAGQEYDEFYGATWFSDVNCVLVGRSDLDGVIVTSSNRGLTWTRTTTGSDLLTDVTSKTVSTLTYIIASTTTGRIYYSTTSKTWTKVTLTTTPLYSVAIDSNGKYFY